MLSNLPSKEACNLSPIGIRLSALWMSLIAALVLSSGCFGTMMPGNAMARLMLPDLTKYSPDEFEQWLAPQIQGFTKEKQQQSSGDMSAPGPVQVVSKAGNCTYVVFRMASEAKFAPDAAPGGVLFHAVETGGEPMDIGPGCHGPGGLAKLNCSRQAKTFAFTLTAGRGNTLGTGAYELEVMSRKATEEELTAIENHDAMVKANVQAADERSASEARKAEAGCRRCQTNYDVCVGNGPGTSACISAFNSCAFEKVGPDYPKTCPRSP
jgi:hypothetical protein